MLCFYVNHCAKYNILVTSFNHNNNLMSSYVPILQRERNPRLREDKGGSQDFKSGLFDSDAKGPEP